MSLLPCLCGYIYTERVWKGGEKNNTWKWKKKYIDTKRKKWTLTSLFPILLFFLDDSVSALLSHKRSSQKWGRGLPIIPGT